MIRTWKQNELNRHDFNLPKQRNHHDRTGNQQKKQKQMILQADQNNAASWYFPHLVQTFGGASCEGQLDWIDCYDALKSFWTCRHFFLKTTWHLAQLLNSSPNFLQCQDFMELIEIQNADEHMNWMNEKTQGTHCCGLLDGVWKSLHKVYGKGYRFGTWESYHFVTRKNYLSWNALVFLFQSGLVSPLVSSWTRVLWGCQYVSSIPRQSIP